MQRRSTAESSWARRIVALPVAAAVLIGPIAAGLGSSPLEAAPPQVTVSVDRSAPNDTFTMAVGHTHTQYSLEAGGDAASIASGRTLLNEAVDIQNQHLYGWGTLNPNPSPDVYNWNSLDRRVQLMRDTGSTPVITLCCAPDWMTELGTETSTYSNRPPLARHYDEFADLARRTAERYPDVRHYVVWNEMKGFWNPGSAQWDYVAYTEMYNAVYDALKGVDPTLQVGGPYLVIESTGTETIGSTINGGWVTEMPVTQRSRVLLEYWTEFGHGADFVAIDRKVKDYHDTRIYEPEETMALTANFDIVAHEVNQITNLPVWFIEQHFVGQRGGPVDFQAAGIASMLYHQMNGGAVVSVGWKPEQAQVGGKVQENLFTSTREAGGGQKLPTYWSYRFFRESFPPGTPRYEVTTSDPLLLGLASADATVLINQRPEPVDVDLDGVTHTLAAYEVARFDAAGAPNGSSTDSVGDEVQPPQQLNQVVEADLRVLADSNGGEIVEIDRDAGPLLAQKISGRGIEPTEAALDAQPNGSAVVEWLDQVGTAQSDSITSVVADGGNVFVGGGTWDALVPGRHRGLSDGFVRRYRADGTIVWSNQFGSPTSQGVADIAVDHNGVYAVGTTDSGIAGQTHNGAFDGTIRAYDRNGRVRWTRQIGTVGDDHATEVVVHRGIVYVVGHTDGTFPGQTLAGSQDSFVAAYSEAGDQLWVRQYGTPRPDFFTDVAADGDHLVLSGSTAGAFEGQTRLGHWDALVLRMELDGDIQWVRQFGSEWDDRGNAVAVTADGIRVAGRAEDSLDGSTFGGVYDGYVRSYTRDGDPGWATMIATPFSDRLDSVVVDPTGTHAVGRTTGEFPGQTAAGSADAVVVSLDSLGQLDQLDQFGTGASDEPASMSTDLANRYIGGTTRGSFDGHVNFGGRDGWVARLVHDDAIVVGDTFTRNTTNSWGVAPEGGTWQVSPRTNFSAGDGVGTVTVVGDTGERAANLRSVDVADVALQFDVTLDQMPSGGSFYMYSVLRKDGANEYRMRLRIQPNGTVSMRAIQRTPGSWQPLGANVTSGLTVAAGDTFSVRFEAETIGANTQLRAAMWPVGTAQPTWDVVVEEPNVAALTTGAAGIRFMAPSPATSLAVSIDNAVAVRL